MEIRHVLLTLFMLAAFSSIGRTENVDLSFYDVVWDTPSRDSLDSMPLSGRLGGGANVWVQDGSIWLYLAHSGAFDEHGRLLKLGCVRLTPKDLNLGGAGFSQSLEPDTGTITIVQGDFRANLWFAGETLVFEAQSATAHPLEVAYGTWREKTKDGIRNDMMGAKTTFRGDHIMASADSFLAFHRNADYAIDLPGKARSQGISPESLPDVTARRVSGLAIAIEGGLTGQPSEAPVRWQFWDGKAWAGTTEVRKQHVITMRLAAAVDADSGKWLAEAKAMLNLEKRKAARADELKRWGEFWSRSHIIINPGKGESDPGFLIGRNYQLFRYMLACNRDGELPLLFNGGIFTTDNNGRIKGNNNDELPTFEGEPVTPDFRRWMGCYFMSQNQRWLGWPTVASGDSDLLSPTTRFYRDRAKVAADRAQKQGADGMVYTEPLDIWGLCPVGPRPDGLCGAAHLTYHFSMGLENAWMNLQANSSTGYPIDQDLEWMIGTVYFYDSFYRSETKKRTDKELGDDGKLLLYPINGLEYASGATNSIDAVCGLRRVTEGLLRLSELPQASRIRLEKIQATLPEIPTGTRQGRQSLLPARSMEGEYNKWEPIEMYAYWPYRLAGITRPDTLQLARDTWETIPADRARLCKQDYSWMANVANMAALAWPQKAKERAIYKMANTAAPQARFPAFFGPGHDWLPDHNWGGAGMTGIQEMILAPEPGPNGKLHLFAGWPEEWDVDFKLHAPGQTVVEGQLQGGKLKSLKVTPESRTKDIVNWLGRQPAYTPPPAPISAGKPITASSTFDQPGYEPAKANDGNLTTRWASDFQARSGWLAIDLGKEVEMDHVWVSEIEWPETREFAIEVKAGDSWKEVARGTTIGPDMRIELGGIKAREIRLHVLKAQRPININEFQVFSR
ncbi:MAG TPA: DUF5703 domain-containing protein [Anaerohalosphaeraceae bacterium]|nr:DUF5703 domain-containing protein [Anaerohalosphaeraceae bacterium]